MFGAAILISLSSSFVYKPQGTIDVDTPLLPIYYPLITSLSVPIICSMFAVWSKYAMINKKISPSDFTFGYFIIAKGIFFGVSIIHF